MGEREALLPHWCESKYQQLEDWMEIMMSMLGYWGLRFWTLWLSSDDPLEYKLESKRILCSRMIATQANIEVPRGLEDLDKHNISKTLEFEPSQDGSTR